MNTGLFWSRLRKSGVIAAALILPHLHADTLIAPDDPGINYYGRFDFTDPKKPKLNWSGAIIEAKFPGPTIGMQVDHGNAYYDIEIDGIKDTVISTGSKQQFIFRSNLSTTEHTVRIKLRSEDHWGIGTFLGLYLASGNKLSAAPAKPVRKIEFIGDSYTAGYGIESTTRECTADTNKKYTNTNLTFAGLVTQAFHAQGIILGWSGAGVVRNYGASEKRSPDPFPTHYDQTLGEADKTVIWDYSKWKPDLVVICLGTNDYSTTPNPDDSMYVGDYHKFINRVLGNYPDASLLCVSTGGTKFQNNVKKVVAEQKTTYNHPKVYFAPYPAGMENTGCDWHPSINDNVKVAKTLIDTIIAKMAWDTGATAVAVVPAQQMPPQRTRTFFTADIVSGKLQITAAKALPAGMPVTILTMRGETVDRNRTGSDRRCAFPMDRYGTGIYLAGHPAYGWVKIAIRK